MSWVEDARKLLQGFVAPELRAISLRLDASEKLNAERHQVLLDKLDGTRREIMLQLELAMAKGKIEELQSARLQTAPPPQ